MIRFISGKVIDLASKAAIIDVGGIGYEVFVPDRSRPNLGENIQLITYHHIREDQQALFGFKSKEELGIFEKLLDVPSIGPKSAMAILSVASPTEIINAVEAGNTGFFQSLPGVGKKSALKIIVELKDKIGEGGLSLPKNSDDLIAALKSLGYETNEVNHVLKALPQNFDKLPDQVNWALKELGK